MAFPYEQYKTLAEPLKVYYPASQGELARTLAQEVDQASQLLAQLLGLPAPEMVLLLVAPADWEFAPPEDADEDAAPETMLPYWTDATEIPTLVVPEQMEMLSSSSTGAGGSVATVTVTVARVAVPHVPLKDST